MTATVIPPFHLAFPVASLAQARAFYGELLSITYAFLRKLRSSRSGGFCPESSC